MELTATDRYSDVVMPLAPGSAAARQANSLPDPASVVWSAVSAATVVALIPAWYVAAPITLPASIAVSFLVLAAGAGFASMGGRYDVDPTTAFELGITGWAIGPLYIAKNAFTSLARQLSPAAASDSGFKSGAASVSRSSRHRQRSEPGLGNLRRTTTPSTVAGRTPPAHQRAKSTAKSTASKDVGAAGSARGGKKP
ncbi:hypothetical protein ACRDU6_08105 [Mycolicibacterium sp. ELW1]|uniref:hypothetical protein n=1 Tax=Mycobacteriaceae TaxID=1762 RepID=UPI0011EDF010|nr:hypothetical protein [Mycobacterium sp. ELW1]QEN12647.1 hypothetical protein D3H54_04655 [Mycobacterium sp. ELW1]